LSIEGLIYLEIERTACSSASSLRDAPRTRSQCTIKIIRGDKRSH